MKNLSPAINPADDTVNRLYHICAKTNIGLHRRFNEDAMLIDDRVIQNDTSEYCSTLGPRPGIGTAVFVADGLGGLPGGARASVCALETLMQLSHEANNLFDPDKLIHRINRKVKDQGLKMRMPAMGTTLSGILLQTEQIAILNAGDSRVYQFQSGGLECLTQDHNLGKTPGVGKVSRHMLTNCIGSNECFVDSHTIPYPKQDTLFMICSDGLHGYVNDENIGLSINDHESDLQACVDHLVNASLAAGGWDNVSVILIKIGSVDSS